MPRICASGWQKPRIARLRWYGWLSSGVERWPIRSGRALLDSVAALARQRASVGDLSAVEGASGRHSNRVVGAEVWAVL